MNAERRKQLDRMTLADIWNPALVSIDEIAEYFKRPDRDPPRLANLAIWPDRQVTAFDQYGMRMRQFEGQLGDVIRAIAGAYRE